MLSTEEALEETTTPTLVEDEHDGVDELDVDPTEPTGPVLVQESPMSSAARMLELASITADQLVADAKAEAESLVTTAQAKADEILEASRSEADQVAAELTRNKDEQTATLDQERTTTLAGLAEEKAALEAQIASLGQQQSDHRSQMRQHLNEQLSLLDAAAPVASAPDASAD
jgi:cell division septum initiation protein DivIVA